MKSTIPTTLPDTGFSFAEAKIPKEISDHIRSLEYEYSFHEEHKGVKYGASDINLYPDLTAIVPWDVSKYEVHWLAKIHDAGFYLHPHRAYHGDNMEYQGPAMILTWLTPDNYHGREFVYGEFTDINFSQNIFPWDYPYLVERGRIQPKTGTFCVMDRLSYKWWHAVTEQKSNGIITLIAELRDGKR